MHFLEDEYDEKELIEQQLLQIEDLNIRREAKEIYNRILEPFYKEMQKSYRLLDERLARQRNAAEDYEIFTAIKPRREVDLTDTFLYPMRKKDMEETLICTEEMIDAVVTGEGYELYQVYVKDSYDKVLEFIHTKQYFPVEIITEYGSYKGKASLEESGIYKEQLFQLYEDFICNGMEWKTINAPHLHKLLKVVLLEADCPKDEEVLEVKVDFGRYREILLPDYVPLWNVTQRKVQTGSYPQETWEGIAFLHTIQEEKLRKDCVYLVQEAEDISEIKTEENGDFVIVCKERKPREWSLREIVTQVSKRNVSDSYLRNGNDIKRPYIRTQAEAIRFAAGLLKGEDVRLIGVSTGLPENRKEIRTYSMDDFLPEEIRNAKDAPKLYFACELKDKENPRNQDILSFLISRMQLVYPEYHCVACV